MPSPHHVVVLLPCQGTAFPQYHGTTKRDIWVRALDALPSKSALRFQVLGPMWSIRNVNAKRRSKGVQEVGQNVAGQTRGRPKTRARKRALTQADAKKTDGAHCRLIRHARGKKRVTRGEVHEKAGVSLSGGLSCVEGSQAERRSPPGSRGAETREKRGCTMTYPSKFLKRR